VSREARKEYYSFKRKANENQYKFNSDVEDHLEEVLGRVEAEELPRQSAEAIEKVKDAAVKDKELILLRQKLLKIQILYYARQLRSSSLYKYY